MKTRFWILPFILLIAIARSPADNRNTYPLPEERGTAGALASLQKLPVWVRVLQITAHPDDESAGTLTWLARKAHARTALFCLTRGEGGQNILGSEKYEQLGLLRSGEMLEASRFYGAELYFGNAADFGFSKTAEETLSKWGRRPTLEKLVLFIRKWRPDIILSRFRGGPEDGHGHHQAAGILAREAFRAAADPKAFPDQLRNGLSPWQAKKYYTSAAPSGWTVRVPVGDYDPVLGRSYREIGVEGYSKHRSQGTGSVFASPGPAFEYFSLEESSVGKESKETSFFDSMETSLAAIYDMAGSNRPAVQFLREDLAKVGQAANSALNAYQPMFPEKSATPVSDGLRILAGAIRKIEDAPLNPETKTLLLDALREKEKDFQSALASLLGIYFDASSQDPTAVPGEKVEIAARFHNRGRETVALKKVDLTAPGKVEEAGARSGPEELPPGNSAVFRYSVHIPLEAGITELFWYLENPRDTQYKMRSTEDPFAPFQKPEICARAVFSYREIEVPIQSAVMAQAGTPLRGADFVELQIVPAISLLLEPETQIMPLNAQAASREFRVSVLNNRKQGSSGIVKLHPPAGWRVEPPETGFNLREKGEVFTATFRLEIPQSARAGSYTVEAAAVLEGKEFRRGYRQISYPENWTRNIYAPAKSRLELSEVRVPPHLTVGYIPGAGDDVPKSIEQLGIRVEVLGAADLAFGSLDRYDVIITGIRAYNVNNDLRAANARLLDYVSRGGTLIVQYVRPLGRPAAGSWGSAFPFGPYPMTVSDSSRITVEDSEVTILDPQHPIFTHPNKISQDDFKGWVQERGLYFMNSWDPRYTPLLSGSDPGEEPKNGGMLYVRYGKGHYIYTGYAWFRQLPAGVSGAFRIFANMISLGNDRSSAPAGEIGGK